MVEKVMFLDQILEIECLMELQVLRFLESEKLVFSEWSVCMRERICYQHNSRTNNNRMSQFGILNIHHTDMLFENFVKIELLFCLQKYTKECQYTTLSMG